MAPICFVNAAVFRTRLEMICDLHKKQQPGGEEKGCFQKVLPPVSGLSLKFLRLFRHTVEPPNNGHSGDRPLVHCREVVPISEGTYNQLGASILSVLPLLRVDC